MKLNKRSLGFITFVFISLIIFSITGVYAIDFPSPQDKYVNDFAGIFSSGEVGQLRGLLQSVDESTSAEVVIVTLNTIDGNAIDEYAIELGKEWKVGKADKNNGIVILYVLDINRIFVATGYGVEGILPDSKIGRLLDENYVSLRDSGKTTDGIIQFTIALSEVLEENKEEILSGQAGRNNYAEVIGVLVPLLIWIIIFFFIFRNAKHHKNRRHGDFPWWLLLFLPSRGPRLGGGFSSGGFSSGGFGGGGFGGGGAGR